MKTLVLIRHGESVWNKENRFTGWTDVGLSEKGMLEAKKGGKSLKDGEFSFDLAYTSVLKRAIQTLNIALEEMDMMWLPVVKSWRLNERHYGALQGMNKLEMVEKFGDEQVQLWRRGFSVQPPALTADDPRYQIHDPRYKDLLPGENPLTESLKDTIHRLMPYWNDVISKDLKANKKVLIAAHGNSLRAIIKHLDNMSDEEIMGLNVPTGIPLVYELDDQLKPLKKYYIGDEEEIRKAIESVANQSKAK
jgi:2,3-bisphosphoglycerate-dependent phosphoglycerate mutase